MPNLRLFPPLMGGKSQTRPACWETRWTRRIKIPISGMCARMWPGQRSPHASYPPPPPRPRPQQAFVPPDGTVPSDGTEGTLGLVVWTGLDRDRQPQTWRSHLSGFTPLHACCNRQLAIDSTSGWRARAWRGGAMRRGGTRGRRPQSRARRRRADAPGIAGRAPAAMAARTVRARCARRRGAWRRRRRRPAAAAAAPRRPRARPQTSMHFDEPRGYRADMSPRAAHVCARRPVGLGSVALERGPCRVHRAPCCTQRSRGARRMPPRGRARRCGRRCRPARTPRQRTRGGNRGMEVTMQLEDVSVGAGHGKVTSVREYGAFVLRGERHGLVHISQIADSFVEDISAWCPRASGRVRVRSFSAPVAPLTDARTLAARR